MYLYIAHWDTQCVNDSVIIGTVDVDTALRFSVDNYPGTHHHTAVWSRLPDLTEQWGGHYSQVFG